jgi:1,4-dihydroxy-2-naphthoate octaprenyltransferase
MLWRAWRKSSVGVDELKLGAWMAAVRLKFLPQGVLPVLLGSAVAWHSHGVFNPLHFFLAFLGMALVQFALTMLNDALDFLYGTDASGRGGKNPYSGGSGVLVDGIITPRAVLWAVLLFYLIALGIGIYLSLAAGFALFYIILVGLFISVFYSAKPFRFAYRGIGEVAMLLGYGPVITLGAYFVQTGEIALLPAIAGLVPGMLMWAMIVVNELPDYEEDKRAGKMNLVVRLGRRRGRDVFISSLIVVYLFIAVSVLSGFFPVYALLALLSTPFAYYSASHLRRYYRDKIKVAAANEAMVKLYSSMMLLITVGFLI